MMNTYNEMLNDINNYNKKFANEFNSPNSKRKKISLCKEWENYESVIEWLDDNLSCRNKDKIVILQDESSCVYSPDTCSLWLRRRIPYDSDDRVLPKFVGEYKYLY